MIVKGVARKTGLPGDIRDGDPGIRRGLDQLDQRMLKGDAGPNSTGIIGSVACHRNLAWFVYILHDVLLH